MNGKWISAFIGKKEALQEDVRRKLYFNSILVWVGVGYVLVLLAIDLFLGCMDTLWIHVIGISFFFLSGLTARIVCPVYARFLLPLSAMVYITLMALHKMDPGSLWFFNVIALTIVTLFTYEEKKKTLLLLIFNLIAFSTTFYFLKEIGPLRYLGFYNEFQYFIKFFICTAASVGIIFAHVRNEYYAEKKLQHATAELKDKQRKYELVLNASGSIVFEYDLIKNRVPANARISKMLGYDDGELGDMTLEEAAQFVHPDDLPDFFGKFEKAYTNCDSYTMEYRVRKKNADYLWVTVSGVIERNALGQPSYLIGTTMPIEERKQSEIKILEQNDKLQKINSELDNFVYHVSHDIRAPLSSILGLANLGKLTSDTAELKRYLSMTEKRALALDKFIHDVLSYSRNTHHEVKPIRFNLKALVDEILADLDYLNNKSVVAVQQLFDDEDEIIADRHRLYVILSNLLSNAMKYRKPKDPSPWIKIRFKNERNFYISVEDNGCGIAQDLLPKIYDMFFRASEISTGSGIGLYIVKETIAKMGGTIEVESEHGEGTLFKVIIPKCNSVGIEQ